MKGRDYRYMEKQLKRHLKETDNQKYGEFVRAKRDANTSATYIGQSTTLALATMAYNSVNANTREAGKDKVNKMVQEYANVYLDDLVKKN